MNDEFAFGLDQEIALKFGLKQGVEISAEEIERVLLAEEKNRAKQRSLTWLSYRDRSEQEIADKLKKIGYDESVILWVLSELKRLNLVNDERYAITYARSKMSSKPMGEFLLRRELKQKGIAESNIEKAIESAYAEKDQSAICTELAEKLILKHKDLEKVKAMKRISDFLLRRGFDWDRIKEIMENLHFREDH